MHAKLPLPTAATTLIALACIWLATSHATAQALPAIVLSPNSGPGGAQVTVTGSGFVPGDTVSIEILGNLETRPLSQATVGQDGRFVSGITLPIDGVYPPQITLLAFPFSSPDRRTAVSLGKAPTAVFTITNPGLVSTPPPAANGRGLPNTGAGSGAAASHVEPIAVLIALLAGGCVLATAAPGLSRKRPSA